MDTDKQTTYDVEIELSNSGPVIRVKTISTESDFSTFDSAYVFARKLFNRIESLEKRHELELTASELSAKIAHLWIEEEGIYKLSEGPKENSHRIALSLLRTYPNCRIEADVVRETNVAQQTVNKQLNGNVKSVAAFFMTCKTGYTLSQSGLEWLSTEVVPSILKKENNSSG